MQMSIRSNIDLNDYQNLINENKIQILTDRLECNQQEIENLKKTNQILLTRMSLFDNLDYELEKERIKNIELRELVQNYREKIESLQNKHQDEIRSLKKQISQKDQFIQIVQNENEKLIIKKEEQINYLRDALKDKISKIQSYEKKIHAIQIQRLNSSYSEDQHQSSIQSYSRLAQNINSMNIQENEQKSMSEEDKAKIFMRKDKSELKIMIKSLSNAQKCLQFGGQQMKVLDKQNDRSMLSASTMNRRSIKNSVNFNKTFYK